MDSQSDHPDVTDAIQKFLKLQDSGLTEEKLQGFLRWCEGRGTQYVREVKAHLDIMAELPEILKSQRSKGDSQTDAEP